MSTVADYVDDAQSEVAYCVNCQPWESGEPVWVRGIRRTLEDLLEELEIPEELRDEVAAAITCPSCGTEEFERWADYGEKTQAEIESEQRWAEWDSQYNDRVEKFARHLEQFPYLGLDHAIGKQIQNAIRKFPKTRIADQEWWRARPPEGSRVFRPRDLLPPTTRNARAEGRFNHFGQSVFYLADTKQAALAEVLDRAAGEGFAWAQQFAIVDAGNILDLRQEIWAEEDSSVPVLALGLINHHLPQLHADPDSAWKPEYFVPRFIADCARYSGFSGITFDSRKHYHQNLVLFAWDESNVKPIGEPKLGVIDPAVLPGGPADF